jgi:acyl-CoA synthetase (AMP-forming)/AMP-acid ligase II
VAETIQAWLERAGTRPDGGLRFLDRHERETWFGWGEVRERALAVCGGLQALGLERGDRMALVFPTGIEFFDAFFGSLLAGAVPVPLYPPVRLGRMGDFLQRMVRMLERSGARLVLADSRVQRLLGEAVALASPNLGCRTLDELPAGRAVPVATQDSDPVLIQFSSGTTADPKAVALSQRAIVAQTEILNGFWPDTEELRHSGLSWLPLYHDMGLIGCVFPALSRDATLTLIAPELFVARPAIWLRALSRYRATVSPAPNFGYSLCVSRISDAEMEGVDLSAWRAALNGAEPVVPAVLRAFSDRFARWGFRPEALTPVYGLSEAALAVTFSGLDSRFESRCFDRELLSRDRIAREAPGGREIVSVGRAVPGFRLRIVDRAGRDLPAGRVGRVWIQGPSLMDGYLGDPIATARALRDGWLDTGDLGFLRDGELYVTGRAKDVIILRGRNYAPEEIERAVDAVPGVRDGCVVAASWLPEDAPGEVLTLFVEASPKVSRAALPEACRQAVLGSTGISPDQVVILAPGTLPRTSSGKLRRGETLRLHLARELAAPAAVRPLRLAG